MRISMIVLFMINDILIKVSPTLKEGIQLAVGFRTNYERLCDSRVWLFRAAGLGVRFTQLSRRDKFNKAQHSVEYNSSFLSKIEGRDCKNGRIVEI